VIAVSLARELDEALGENPLVAYGWSADGILAALLALTLRPGRGLAVEEGVPGPGTLEAVARLRRRGHTGVLLAGAGWPSRLVDDLAVMLLSPLAVVDVRWPSGRPRRPNVVFLHPAPRGDPNGYWPSTALYLSTLHGNPHPVLAAAGVVAMLGPAARAHRLYQNLMAMAGLDPNRDYSLPRECALQAYGAASMGDPGVHSQVPESLAALGDPCSALLRDHLLTTLRAQAEAALGEVRSEHRGVEGAFHRYQARGWGRHAMEVARPLAFRHGHPGVRGRVLRRYVPLRLVHPARGPPACPGPPPAPRAWGPRVGHLSGGAQPGLRRV